MKLGLLEKSSTSSLNNISSTELWQGIASPLYRLYAKIFSKFKYFHTFNIFLNWLHSFIIFCWNFVLINGNISQGRTRVSDWLQQRTLTFSACLSSSLEWKTTFLSGPDNPSGTVVLRVLMFLGTARLEVVCSEEESEETPAQAAEERDRPTDTTGDVTMWELVF